MRGKFSAVIREFEEGGSGGFLANKEKLLILSEFQGVILHLFPRFGDISPRRKGQELGEEDRRCQQWVQPHHTLSDSEDPLLWGLIPARAQQDLGCSAAAPGAAPGATFPPEPPITEVML